MFDVTGIERMARKIARFKEDVPKIAAKEVKAQITEFAAEGRNPDGTSFKPYTKPYAKVRIRKGLQTSPVNLRVTGGFLDQIKDRDGIVGPDEAHAKIAEGLARKRTSFEVSPLTPPNIERLLKQAWETMS